MPRLPVLFAALLTASGVQAQTPFLAGQWDITVSIEKIDGSAVTPQMKQQMLTQKPNTQRQCLTAEQLTPSPEKLTRESGGKCKATNFVLAGGKMSSSTLCSGQGPTVTSTTTGTYEAKQYAFRSVSRIVAPKGEMMTTVLTSGKWAGPCAAK